MGTEFNQRAWLSWLVKVRILIVTFLLGMQLAIARLTSRGDEPLTAFVAVIAAWYAIAVFFLFMDWLWKRDSRPLAVIHILSDLGFATAVIYVTGGVDSYFTFLLPLVIIIACILLPRGLAYLTAAFAFILFGAVVELAYFELIPSYSSIRPNLKLLQASIFINLFAYLAVAYLAANLATKLRYADSRLATTSGALENLQALHENIINSMRGGLITTDLEGRITFINAPAERLLEFPAEDVLGRPVAELFLDALPTSEDAVAQGEVRAVTGGGGQKILGITGSPLLVPDRGVLGHVFTFVDLTDMRRLEREVRMRDRLAAVGRMAAGIAHEIRNPLASIAGSVHMLRHLSTLTTEQRTLIEIVTRESERLNAIISDFLVYSREKNYRFVEHDLAHLLNDTLTLLQTRLQQAPVGIDVVRNFEVESAPAIVDGDKMKQVFWNVTENALRAMPEGGRLVVTLAPSADQQGWNVTFADTGCGLTPQQIEKIFEPFQSAFDGGTGLGLAIVYQIMQAHNAKVSVNSRPGKGAEFVLELKSGVVQDAPQRGDHHAARAHAGGLRG